MKKRMILLVFVLLIGINHVFAQTNAKIVEATYIECTVYTGKTDYFFKNVKTKDTISVAVSNVPDDNSLKPKLPKNLIDPSKNLEGPLGANPALVGKTFLIYYTKDGETINKIVKKPLNK